MEDHYVLLLSVVYNAKILFRFSAFISIGYNLKPLYFSWIHPPSSPFLHHLLLHFAVSSSLKNSQTFSLLLTPVRLTPLVLSTAPPSPRPILTLRSEEQTWLLPNWGCQFPPPILPPLWRLPLFVPHNNLGAPVMCQRALPVPSHLLPAQVCRQLHLLGPSSTFP